MSRDEAIDRSIELRDYYLNLAINRFYWNNLPYGLTSEQLELMLIQYGTLLGFQDKLRGLLILPCFGTSQFNVYGLPTKYRVNSLNGKYNETIDIDEGVLLKNNPLGTPEYSTLEIYAERINDIERTQDVNLFQQNIPKLLLTDEDGKLTAKNIIAKLQRFKFVLIGRNTLSKSLSTNDVLDTSAPYLLDKLQEQKEDLKNELLAYLGINNVSNMKKKERMIVDEVNANNEFTSINLDLMFDMRKKFVDEFNQKFGTNIEVEKRKVEVELNGEVHSYPTEFNRE